MFSILKIANLFLNKLRLRTTQKKPFFIACLIVSLLIHTVLFFVLKSDDLRNPTFDKMDLVELEIIDKDPLPIVKDKHLEKQIIETPLEKTQKPPESGFLSKNNHRAKKETKLKKEYFNQPNIKGLDATRKPSSRRNKTAQPQKMEQEIYDSLVAESFLAMQQQSLEELGFKDYIEGELAEGDAIDLNTTEYRYIGYFTNLRKAIELAWVYPSSAANKGIEGVVKILFAINKNGDLSTLKVLSSSGYGILDRYILQAIRMASPFAPLPESLPEDNLVITGSFVYILSGSASSY